MLFNNKFSKFGRGKNISTIMTNEKQIDVYYYNKGILKKTIKIEDQTLTLTNSNQTFPYNEIIPVTNKYIVTRIDKSIGITTNE